MSLERGEGGATAVKQVTTAMCSRDQSYLEPSPKDEPWEPTFLGAALAKAPIRHHGYPQHCHPHPSYPQDRCPRETREASMT